MFIYSLGSNGNLATGRKCATNLITTMIVSFIDQFDSNETVGDGKEEEGIEEGEREVEFKNLQTQ